MQIHTNPNIKNDRITRKRSFRYLKYAEQDHTYRIYCKIGEDMDYPRGVDGLAFAVKQIENDSADEKREDDEGCKSEGVPSDHHRDMIQRKADRAEDTRPL